MISNVPRLVFCDTTKVECDDGSIFVPSRIRSHTYVRAPCPRVRIDVERPPAQIEVLIKIRQPTPDCGNCICAQATL